MQDFPDDTTSSDIQVFSVIMVINFDPIVDNEPVQLKVKEQVTPTSIKHGLHSKMTLEPIGQIISEWVSSKTQKAALGMWNLINFDIANLSWLWL